MKKHGKTPRLFFRVTFMTIILLNFLGVFTFASYIKNINIEDGLSNRRVYGSANDSKGYIWFATKTHIDRFDGEQFDSYKLSDNEKNRGIISDNQDKLYAFTERSIYFYNEKNDRFDLLYTLDSGIDFFREASLNTLFFDSKDRLYAGTSKGLIVFENSNPHYPKDFYGTQVHSFTNYINDKVLIGTSTGLYKISWDSGTIGFDGMLFPGIFKKFRIQSIYFDQNTGSLLIGTFAHGLYITLSIDNSSPDKLLSISLPIKKISLISGNEIWIGSDGDGIYVFDRFTLKLKKRIAQSEIGDEKIEANGIYDILEANNSVWISTYTGGVYMLNTRSIVDKVFTHEKYNKNSLNNDHVNAILEDSNGDIWFGTNTGVSVYRTNNNSWDHFLTGSSPYNHENSVVLTLYEDRQQNIWVGGYATLLCKINSRTRRVTYLDNNPDELFHGKSYIYDIKEDESGKIWMGGSVDVLKSFNPATGELKKYQLEGIVRILNWDFQTLLLATYKGLYQFNKIDGKAKVIDLRNAKGVGIKNGFPYINNIVKDKSSADVVYLGTEGYGLLKYNIKTNEINVLNTKAGLSSDYVYGLIYDDSDRLWISTEYGLNCYDSKTGIIHSYFQFDGLSDNTFNFLSYVKLKDGRILLGTPKGVNVLSPAKIAKNNQEEFNLRLKGFYLFYDQIRALSEKSPLKTSIDETDEIRLTYQQHSFTIDFINLNFANQKSTLYSWKLDGFDNDWSKPSREHKAVYTNVPAGQYTFMVKAMSISTKNESGIRLIKIRKTPPFWASTYAYFIYIGLLIWLAYFIFRYWMNKFDSRLTQDKIRFFVSMAHEIRTPLTLIKAPLNEIDNENLTQNGRMALELARKNTDKLHATVNQLLDFQKIESDAMELCIEETHLNVYIDNILNNFQYLVKTKGIHLISSKETIGQATVWIDRNKVQMMLENLLTNAIKYTNTNGQITVFVEVKEGQKLVIQVRDNGIGIPQTAQNKLFNTFYRAANAASSVEIGTGIGLMFTKKLVQLHKGTISFISSENVGTTFRIELPVKKDDYTEEEIFIRKSEDIETEIIEEDSTHQQMQILLVEDNDELRTYLSKMLRKQYAIEEASNGVEALKVLESVSPELILSDVLMPEMNGYDLCKHVKSNISTCHIPFILLTSLSEREDVIMGLNCGADDYITKPFDMTILESKIKAIFNNRALFRKKYIEKSISLNENNLLNDLNKNFIKKLVDIIELNITREEFNIDEIASEMAMSRSVFFKKVKSLTNQNPKDFIRDIKMNKAADLLRDKKYSISEIAYLIGFPNAKYFSTAFKKYYGVSPTTFIDKEKKEDSYMNQLNSETED